MTFLQRKKCFKYTVRAPLYAAACILFTPFITAAYNQEWLIFNTIWVLNKKILQKNPRFIKKTGFKSREGYNGVHTVNGKDEKFLNQDLPVCTR